MNYSNFKDLTAHFKADLTPVTITAADKEVTYIDANGETHIHNRKTVIYDVGYTTATLTEVYDKETFDSSDYGDYVSTLRKIDASRVEGDISITGTKYADNIIGSNQDDVLNGDRGADSLFGGGGNDTLYGGTGNDKLWGGADNDTLWGGAGSDTFYYDDGDGKDKIFDFDENDMLQITGTFSGTYNAGTNVISIKVGSTTNAITLENYATNTFNINGSDYVIKGTKLVQQ